MGLKGLLLGHEVKVYYDRHLTKTEKAEDAENPSEYEILKGVVNGVYKDMILISYSYRENVQTTKKGLFSDKEIEEEKTVEAHSLINRKCIVRVDILDLSLDGEEEEYDEGEDSEQDKEVSRIMFKNTFVYNTGRVISYTIIGGVLGDSRWM